jgi:ABC-2 type transport system ATP-binding protein
VHSKREVQGVIKDLNRQYGLTILLATQDKVEADNLCDRTAIIERGKIVALDTSHGFRQNISPHEYEPTREMFTT